MEDPFDPFVDALSDFDDLDRSWEEEERAKFLAQSPRATVSRAQGDFLEREPVPSDISACLVAYKGSAAEPADGEAVCATYAQSPFDTIFIITDTMRRADTVYVRAYDAETYEDVVFRWENVRRRLSESERDVNLRAVRVRLRGVGRSKCDNGAMRAIRVRLRGVHEKAVDGPRRNVRIMLRGVQQAAPPLCRSFSGKRAAKKRSGRSGKSNWAAWNKKHTESALS